MNRPLETGAAFTDHEQLSQAIETAAHHLPAQGPIGRFVHHNTLHAFQHLPFEEAVVEAQHIYGAEPFMPASWYRARRDEGRIGEEDVVAVLERNDDADRVVAAGMSRRGLSRRLMEIDSADLDDELVRYLLAERETLVEPSAAALWSEAARLVDAEQLGVARAERPPSPSELAVNASMGKLAGMFLDQGMAYWPMPGREHGFYQATRALWALPGHVDPAELRGAGAAFREQARSDETAEGVVLRWLETRGLPPSEWAARIERTLLKTPGWAGLFHVFEETPAVAPRFAPPCSLVDFLAVRLTLETVVATAETEVEAPRPPTRQPLVATHELFELAADLGWSAAELGAMPRSERRALGELLGHFDDVARRCTWHLAYERQHRRTVLGALATHRARTDPNPRRPVPKAQVFFCIDDREESIRRHLEELDPGWETFGATGFYGVAIEYKGHDDVHGTALCPVSVTPDLHVAERAVEHDRHLSDQRAARRRLAAIFGRGAWVGSRGLVRGWLVTAGLGLLSALPLSGRVLFPGLMVKLHRRLAEALLPAPRTELAITRREGGGMDTAEKVDRVAGILRTAGLIDGFAPLVMILGHGSSSLNNPHEAAHDCGACAGGRGRPNARLFAAMANEEAVRKGLREAHGIDITDTTWFVGGYHDTCSDAVVYDDLDAVPEARRPQLDELIAALDVARARNAHERCRLFEWSPRDRSPQSALAHVEARAEHLAEPRPEYGHATNALCIVGRRALTRGLFFDRRAFLVSYDPTQDDDGEVLGPLLASVGPVGAGINLEYYFSFVDNERYGCGTKLPHNVTGLVGVVNGHASDLRTGLPWQMVEIHEPVRLLTIVESTPETLLAIAERFPAVGELVGHRWIQLVSVDPVTGAIHVFEDGRFVSFDERAPVAEHPLSADLYGGQTGRLPVAAIAAALPSAPQPLEAPSHDA